MNEKQISIDCPTCGPVTSMVCDSRPIKRHGISTISRRRQCLVCGKRIRTFELPFDYFEKLQRSIREQAIKEMQKTIERINK